MWKELQRLPYLSTTDQNYDSKLSTEYNIFDDVLTLYILLNTIWNYEPNEILLTDCIPQSSYYYWLTPLSFPKKQAKILI
jgi:hypothetical protein